MPAHNRKTLGRKVSLSLSLLCTPPWASLPCPAASRRWRRPLALPALVVVGRTGIEAGLLVAMLSELCWSIKRVWFHGCDLEVWQDLLCKFVSFGWAAWCRSGAAPDLCWPGSTPERWLRRWGSIAAVAWPDPYSIWVESSNSFGWIWGLACGVFHVVEIEDGGGCRDGRWRLAVGGAALRLLRGFESGFW